MAGLVSVTPPVSGNTISSSLFGIPTATNLGVLANPPLAKMTNSGAQSIPTGTTTALTWDSEVFDTVGGHSTSSNTSRYTAQTGYAGYYRVHATAAWTANATGQRRVTVGVNGSATDASADNQAPSGTITTTVATDTIVYLNAADYVEAFVFQTSGGALALATGGAGVTLQSWFEVQWLHQ